MNMNRDTPAAKISTFAPEYGLDFNNYGAINPGVPNTVVKAPFEPFSGLPLMGPANPKSAILRCNP